MVSVSEEPVSLAAVFFVAGGTVPPDSPSYVERAADNELFDALTDGQYCFVLNARQMGKSSLAVRTILRLTARGIRCAFVDLTRFGGATVTPDQWYTGLLVETGRALGLRSEAVAFVKEFRELGPVERFLSFLQEVAIQKVDGPLVLMIDEIDAVRSLPFPTDELFTGIRFLFNGRAANPELGRLTICLLGSALPTDLVSDARTTPFNIGRRIGLRDFTTDEVRPLGQRLGLQGNLIISRVLYWTGGHPYLTQAVCAELSELSSPTVFDVDRIVKARYLDTRARESDTNLVDLSNRLLGRGDPAVSDADRADTLSMYGILLRRGVADNEANQASARIKMSGAARIENGLLLPRNRIYSTVFNHRWIKANMPGEELRRQKRAFLAGAVRTGIVSALIIIILGAMALIAYTGAKIARAEQRKSMGLLETSRELANSEGLAKMQALQAVEDAQRSLRREREAERQLKIAIAQERQARLDAIKSAAEAKKAAQRERAAARLSAQLERSEREHMNSSSALLNPILNSILRQDRPPTEVELATIACASLGLFPEAIKTNIANIQAVEARFGDELSDPKNGILRELFALAVCRSGQLGRAELLMRNALSARGLQPKEELAKFDSGRMILALIHAKKGDLKTARKELNRSYSLIAQLDDLPGKPSSKTEMVASWWGPIYQSVQSEVEDLVSRKNSH